MSNNINDIVDTWTDTFINIAKEFIPYTKSHYSKYTTLHIQCIYGFQFVPLVSNSMWLGQIILLKSVEQAIVNRKR